MFKCTNIYQLKAHMDKPSLVNRREQTATHTFSVTMRDRDHFYKVVSWLNKNVGKGSQYWTMGGSILRHIKAGRTVTTTVYIFTEDFPEDSALYLSLL